MSLFTWAWRGWLLCAFGIALDQLTKWLSERFLGAYDQLEIVPSILSFQLVKNDGAAYGIFSGHLFFLIMVSLAVIGFCVFFRSFFEENETLMRARLFLIMGATGNLIDRVVHGYVVDFINIHIIPVFNLADIYINIAVLCLIIDYVKSWRSDHGKT